MGMAPILSGISWVEEKVFPLFPYWRNVRKLRSLIAANDLFQRKPNYETYVSLSAEQLVKRLEDERVRAVTLDEKTFKMTLSLSLALTVVGTAYAVLLPAVLKPWIGLALAVLVWLAILYIFVAGFLALGALKTQQSFMYGTEAAKFPAEENKTRYADALARQELSNNTRHLRNEASFQCLLNGFFLLFVSLAIFAVSKTYFSSASVPKSLTYAVPLCWT
jgi:hypothetical protein